VTLTSTRRLPKRRMPPRACQALLALLVSVVSCASFAQQPEPPRPAADPGRAYVLGTGDVVRVTVFQQQDMLTETRVAETGTITVPLVGPVEVGGGTAKQAEDRIAKLLKSRGFVKDPQVNVTVLQFNSQQVSVLGHVNRPGRFPLQEGTYYLTDIIALAGGVALDGADIATLIRLRAGKTITLEVDLPALFRSNGTMTNPEVVGGDSVFVDRYPYFYIYGEVQRPGVYRLEKGMTVMQALSVGGGLTLRASKKDIQLNRRDKSGKVVTAGVQLNDQLLPDDVVYVKESLF
jgi:polysaccharide biosynthesis/export protein